MPYAEDPEKWHKLNALYDGKSNDELLELRAVYDDLTEDAQGILRTQLTRRRLWSDSDLLSDLPDEPSPEPGDPTPETSVDTYSEYKLFQMGGVALCECETTEEAELIRFVLDRSKIDSVLRQRQDKFYVRWPQVLIAPDDLEKAQAILAGGISSKLREEFESLPVEVDFQNPACPRCGSLDALLESVDPTSHWLCGECGTQWQDTLPE